MLIYQTHYRQQLDLTDEALEGAAKGARRLGEFGRRLLGGGSEGSGGSGGSSESAGFVEAAAKLRADFAEAMDDDLNAPRALAAVFDFVSEGNRLLDAGEVAGPEARDAWALADGVLDASTESRTLEVRDDAHSREDPGVIKRPGGDSPPADPVQAEEWAFLWATERSKAKKNKNFAEADRIRDLLSGAGFEVRDTPQGPEIIKR